ncbi:MAG: LytR family transcriptional regulator, partial [Micrococcus sp.]|nr:LytR family transcriptional regulator [Micrococcus sp.]
MAYPADRFDDVPEYTDQHGAHREAFAAAPAGAAGAAGSTAAAGGGGGILKWLLAAAAALLLLGLFLGLVLPRLTGGDEGPVAGGDASSSEPAPATSSPATEPGTASAPASSADPAQASQDAQRSQEA